jgi:hypothetical protein
MHMHTCTPGAYGAHGLHKRLQELEAEGRNPFAPPKPTQAAASALAQASDSVKAFFGGAAASKTTTTAPRSPAATLSSSSKPPSPTAHDVWSRAGASLFLKCV